MPTRLDRKVQKKMRLHYDIFVSYSHADEVFVTDWLVPYLEAKGYDICLDSRDFEIGTPSLVNMERAAERSRHTILVLSPAWVSSEWTTFESFLVGTSDPAGVRRKLLPIMLETCDLPSRLSIFTFADLRDVDLRERELLRLVNQLRREPVVSADDAGEPGQGIAPTPSLIEAYRLAIVHLLGMQYPWGEWSDRRTAMESSIAERRSFRGPEGPKPNVARTLFAIEALRHVPTQESSRSFEHALEWISRGVSNGWYLEWTTQQVLDSEDHLPPLVLRKDVRHTAQAATVLAMWKLSAEPLGSLVASVAESQLAGGLWPEGPGENSPRVLASIYAIESLAYSLLGPSSRLIQATLGSNAFNEIWSAFRLGVAALHREVDAGQGLLGESASGATPYLTGIGLFRLAPLASKHHEIQSLCVKMIAALEASSGIDGWQDASTATTARIATQKRTTLRVAAGLTRSVAAGLPVSRQVHTQARWLVERILLSAVALELDSPDYACAAIALAEPRLSVGEGDSIADIARESSALKRTYLDYWTRAREAHLQILLEGRALGLPGYDELSRRVEGELAMLKPTGRSATQG